MTEALLPIGILLLAFLYSSVGHAGASGYIAAMGIAGVALGDIRPAALMMNIGVALIGMWHFIRAGHFRWSLTWPFLVASLPFAFLGGMVKLPPHAVGGVLGAVLLFSAIRFLLPTTDGPEKGNPPGLPVALATGGMLGFLAGLTGTGGGIFLTPLLIITGWAGTRAAAATSVVFIAGNSVSGLIGFGMGEGIIPWHLASLFPFALIGGFAGSRLGSKHFEARTIRRMLAIVLIIAAFKFLSKLSFT